MGISSNAVLPAIEILLQRNFGDRVLVHVLRM
jgi:hypothetical protein